jgi:nitroreductase
MGLHPLIINRYSPKSYQDKSLTKYEIQEILEAAGRSASSFNEQPWAFVYALRSEEANFEKLLTLINEHNRKWAEHAGALVIAFAKKTFHHNGRGNRHAWHDVGMSINTMTFQANSMGIYMRQMAGFFSEQAESDLSAPDNYEAVSAIALGFPDPEEMEYKRNHPVSRRPLEEYAFAGQWNS